MVNSHFCSKASILSGRLFQWQSFMARTSLFIAPLSTSFSVPCYQYPHKKEGSTARSPVGNRVVSRRWFLIRLVHSYYPGKVTRNYAIFAGSVPVNVWLTIRQIYSIYLSNRDRYRIVNTFNMYDMHMHGVNQTVQDLTPIHQIKNSKPCIFAQL